jgi:hypothetical protein
MRLHLRIKRSDSADERVEFERMVASLCRIAHVSRQRRAFVTLVTNEAYVLAAAVLAAIDAAREHDRFRLSRLLTDALALFQRRRCIETVGGFAGFDYALLRRPDCQSGAQQCAQRWRRRCRAARAGAQSSTCSPSCACLRSLRLSSSSFSTPTASCCHNIDHLLARSLAMSSLRLHRRCSRSTSAPARRSNDTTGSITRTPSGATVIAGSCITARWISSTTTLAQCC